MDLIEELLIYVSKESICFEDLYELLAPEKILPLLNTTQEYKKKSYEVWFADAKSYEDLANCLLLVYEDLIEETFHKRYPRLPNSFEILHAESSVFSLK